MSCESSLQLLPYKGEAEGLCHYSYFIIFFFGFGALFAPLAFVSPGSAMYTLGTGLGEVSFGAAPVTSSFPSWALFLSNFKRVWSMRRLLASPARGSDPVDQLALNLDSQTLDSICQLDLSHLGNLSARVGTENVIFQITVQAIEQEYWGLCHGYSHARLIH